MTMQTGGVTATEVALPEHDAPHVAGHGSRPRGERLDRTYLWMLLPGLVLFTVFIAVLVVVLWTVYVGSLVHSAERVRAHARWRRAAGSIERQDGTVRARTVSTIEDGGVDRFELAVDTAAGPLLATWERATARAPMLLQTQVPGVGARARVWRIRDAGADAPLVIEVRDPSVVTPAPDPA